MSDSPTASTQSYCAYGNYQCFNDVVVAASFGDQANYLCFSLGQAIGIGMGQVGPFNPSTPALI